jgi:hypothetical protein
MTGWVSEPLTQPSVENGGFVVAGMGRRLVAWIVDAIVASFLVIVPFSVAIASRAVTVNSDVIDKVANDSRSVINEPLLNINVTVVWLAVAGWVVLRAAYFAGSWTLFGGTLAQRLLSIDVLTVEDADKRLPVGRAIVRWLALEGVGQIATAVALAILIQVLASVPFSETSYGAAISRSAVAVDPQGRVANSLSSVASWGSGLWSIVLLVSVATNVFKRGVHDRLAGSIVLARSPRDWQGYERWGRTDDPRTGYGRAPTGYPDSPPVPGRPVDGARPQVPPPDGPAA